MSRENLNKKDQSKSETDDDFDLSLDSKVGSNIFVKPKIKDLDVDTFRVKKEKDHKIGKVSNLGAALPGSKLDEQKSTNVEQKKSTSVEPKLEKKNLKTSKSKTSPDVKHSETSDANVSKLSEKSSKDKSKQSSIHENLMRLIDLGTKQDENKKEEDSNKKSTLTQKSSSCAGSSIPKDLISSKSDKKTNSGKKEKGQHEHSKDKSSLSSFHSSSSVGSNFVGQSVVTRRSFLSKINTHKLESFQGSKKSKTSTENKCKSLHSHASSATNVKHKSPKAKDGAHDLVKKFESLKNYSKDQSRVSSKLSTSESAVSDVYSVPSSSVSSSCSSAVKKNPNSKA